MMTIDEALQRIRDARAQCERISDANWRADDTGELHALAAILEAEVTLLEQELAEMGAIA